MRPEQIQHVAEVVLHLKFLAVRLLSASREDQLPAACLTLEQLCGDSLKGVLATPEDGQELLRLVNDRFEPFWYAELAKRGEPAVETPERTQHYLLQAVVGLLRTSWAPKVIPPLARGRIYESAWEAKEYLRIREMVLGWSRLQPVAEVDGLAFCELILKQMRGGQFQ
jgi:hypothetical protein